jgi:phosphoribosylamine--glycine ligase
VTKVCVVGGDGRAHVLADVLGRTSEVVVTPGNPGIAGSLAADPLDVEADLFVISPEQPLVDGLADALRARGRLVFGPGADGARLEGSKRWMKAVLAEAGVPTARSAAFTDPEMAAAYLRTLPGLYVVKTDGLAAGKGVLVTESLPEALDDVAAKLSGAAFGEAGRTVVIEEGLTGPEVSLHAVCDGSRAEVLPPAQDHKRVGDGDTGPNTGGMGAFSPVELAPGSVGEVMEGAVLPTLHALRKHGVDYRGALYAGLMLTPEGVKVLEYNVRFGDPEAQVVLPRVDGDLTAFLRSAAEGRLGVVPPVVDDAAVTVVCACEGYPVATRTGDVIAGLDAASALPGVAVYCAGVDAGDDGGLVTAGGRVLDVTALGPTVPEARRRAYAGVAEISWPGMFTRTDIAGPAVEAMAHR